MLVAWHALTPAQRNAVLALQIDAQQVEFAGTIERAVAQCRADAAANEVAGLGILHERVVVGFLLLKRRGAAPTWLGTDAALVSALRIDARLQGQGLGSAALRRLPAWLAVHWSDCRSLTLTVDEQNAAAIRAYSKAGFTDLGLREAGRIGWVRTMSAPVPPRP